MISSLIQPPDYAQHLSDLNAHMEHQKARYDAGELSGDQFTQALEKIRAAKSELHRQANEWRDTHAPGWRDALTIPSQFL